MRRIAHALLISTRTPHAGSDVDDLSHISEHCQFQPALPMRGVTYHFAAGDSAKQISTRTPHAGSDRTVRRFHLHGTISTRTPHAGSDVWFGGVRLQQRISTRTPHAGSDRYTRIRGWSDTISTRTPHAGSDIAHSFFAYMLSAFQPALPMRGVTPLLLLALLGHTDFNPHSPCGE